MKKSAKLKNKTITVLRPYNALLVSDENIGKMYAPLGATELINKDIEELANLIICTFNQFQSIMSKWVLHLSIKEEEQQLSQNVLHLDEIEGFSILNVSGVSGCANNSLLVNFDLPDILYQDYTFICIHIGDYYDFINNSWVNDIYTLFDRFLKTINSGCSVNHLAEKIKRIKDLKIPNIDINDLNRIETDLIGIKHDLYKPETWHGKAEWLRQNGYHLEMNGIDTGFPQSDDGYNWEVQAKGIGSFVGYDIPSAIERTYDYITSNNDLITKFHYTSTEQSTSNIKKSHLALLKSTESKAIWNIDLTDEKFARISINFGNVVLYDEVMNLPSVVSDAIYKMGEKLSDSKLMKEFESYLDLFKSTIDDHNLEPKIHINNLDFYFSYRLVGDIEHKTDYINTDDLKSLIKNIKTAATKEKAFIDESGITDK